MISKVRVNDYTMLEGYTNANQVRIMRDVIAI